MSWSPNATSLHLLSIAGSTIGDIKVEVSVSSMICASLKEALEAIGDRQSDERNVSSPAEDPHVLIMDAVSDDPKRPRAGTAKSMSRPTRPMRCSHVLISMGLAKGAIPCMIDLRRSAPHRDPTITTYYNGVPYLTDDYGPTSRVPTRRRSRSTSRSSSLHFGLRP